MNREIEFRGKRVDNGQWVYGHYFKTPLTDENSGTKPDAGWFFLTGETRYCIAQGGVAFVVDPETVGQFTGLFDKNSKKIFEEDLVKSDIHNPPVYLMEFIEGGFCATNKECMNIDINHFFHSMGIDISVIGNIHEHPELLTAVQ